MHIFQSHRHHISIYRLAFLMKRIEPFMKIFNTNTAKLLYESPNKLERCYMQQKERKKIWRFKRLLFNSSQIVPLAKLQNWVKICTGDAKQLWCVQTKCNSLRVWSIFSRHHFTEFCLVFSCMPFIPGLKCTHQLQIVILTWNFSTEVIDIVGNRLLLF